MVVVVVVAVVGCKLEVVAGCSSSCWVVAGAVGCSSNCWLLQSMLVVV